MSSGKMYLYWSTFEDKSMKEIFLTFYIVLLNHHTIGTSNLANQVGFDHVGQLNSLNDNKEIQ